MVTPRPSEYTTERHDHLNPEVVEKNYFKCNFMKMMETFTKEVKNYKQKVGRN